MGFSHKMNLSVNLLPGISREHLLGALKPLLDEFGVDDNDLAEFDMDGMDRVGIVDGLDVTLESGVLTIETTGEAAFGYDDVLQALGESMLDVIDGKALLISLNDRDEDTVKDIVVARTDADKEKFRFNLALHEASSLMESVVPGLGAKVRQLALKERANKFALSSVTAKPVAPVDAGTIETDMLVRHRDGRIGVVDSFFGAQSGDPGVALRSLNNNDMTLFICTRSQLVPAGALLAVEGGAEPIAYTHFDQWEDMNDADSVTRDLRNVLESWSVSLGIPEISPENISCLMLPEFNELRGMHPDGYPAVLHDAIGVIIDRGYAVYASENFIEIYHTKDINFSENDIEEYTRKIITSEPAARMKP